MIEEKLAALTAAIEANTSALREILDAGSVPSNVTELVKPAKVRRKTTPITETEDGEESPTKVNDAMVKQANEMNAEQAPVVETPAEPEPEPPDHVFVAKESSTPDPETLIASIIETFKARMTGAPDAERKGFLKTQLPVLRAKWGLGPDDKLAVLTPTPEKLVGLLADIEAL